MPVELFLSPLMRPIVKARAAMMSIHSDSDYYTPTIIDLPSDAKKYLIRKEFGTGSKVFSVFDTKVTDVTSYDRKLYHMTRSRAVKGAYKLYAQGDDLPIGALRAGLRSNVLLFKTKNGSELELGWHVVDHKVDALDQYRVFQMADGQTYMWTFKGHYLERVHNYGQKEAEVRERVAHATVYPNRKGFDLEVDEKSVNLEMVITTALICYIEAWNTWRGYGGIYLAEMPQPKRAWKKDF